MKIKDFLNFRLMITPFVIRGIYIVATLGAIVFAIALLAGVSLDNLGLPELFTRSPRVSGGILLVFGPLIIRMGCETAIVFFRIGDKFFMMEKRLGKSMFLKF
ncbi:MAG: hypothetical protein ACI86H_001830 [bacterium]|jgi:hypothetical protein